MTRDSQEFKTEKARQLLNDPILKEAFENVEKSIVSSLKTANLNGDPSQVDFVVELTRKLQTVQGVKRSLEKEIDNAKIKEFNTLNKAV